MGGRCYLFSASVERNGAPHLRCDEGASLREDLNAMVRYFRLAVMKELMDWSYGAMLVRMPPVRVEAVPVW
ncbi:hypothetical protein PPGU19_070830 (plasmid) [Paraburkholderia sp. PGU19]|nr:hypothetical protein PPGU19_070830 [Paraburkholderia sp. PGU19]